VQHFRLAANSIFTKILKAYKKTALIFLKVQ